MRAYEITCVFRPEDEQFVRGREMVKQELAKLDATINKEEDMSVRTLAYTVKSMNQGHYYVYFVEMEPEKAAQIEEILKLKQELLKVLVIRKDD